MKEPRRWSINDRIRRRIPSGKENLEEIADHLDLGTTIDATAMFDDGIRKDSVYLVGLVSGKRKLSFSNSGSTSSSTHVRHNLAG